MPMHVRVCAGGAEVGVCRLGTWERGAPPAGLPSLGYDTPACPCSPKRQTFLAVQGRSGFPAAGSTVPLSSMGTAGGPSSLTQPPAQCRVTATTMSHRHLSSRHTVPTRPLLHLEHLHYRLEPAWLCAGRGDTYSAPGSRAQHHDAQET